MAEAENNVEGQGESWPCFTTCLSYENSLPWFPASFNPMPVRHVQSLLKPMIPRSNLQFKGPDRKYTIMEQKLELVCKLHYYTKVHYVMKFRVGKWHNVIKFRPRNLSERDCIAGTGLPFIATSLFADDVPVNKGCCL